MVDLKPPRLVAGERETLLALLQYQRESLVRKVSGVDEAAARQQYVGSGTSLLWLIKHVAHAETIWVVQRFAGQPAESDDSVNPDDTVAAAIDAYRQTWVRVESIVSRADLDDTCRALGDDAPVSLR
ncbi:MAG: mycothiol transferase, partial [Ilumatobacteraceae bacterium]